MSSKREMCWRFTFELLAVIIIFIGFSLILFFFYSAGQGTVRSPLHRWQTVVDDSRFTYNSKNCTDEECSISSNISRTNVFHSESLIRLYFLQIRVVILFYRCIGEERMFLSWIQLYYNVVLSCRIAKLIWSSANEMSAVHVPPSACLSLSSFSFALLYGPVPPSMVLVRTSYIVHVLIFVISLYLLMCKTQSVLAFVLLVSAS